MIYVCRYQQSPSDEERRFVDTAQLCSNVRLRFLCPDDLEEVCERTIMALIIVMTVNCIVHVCHLFNIGTHIMSGLVSYRLPVVVVRRHNFKHTVLRTGRRL